jgi:CRISPR/Cas system-associated protein Csm6
MRKVITMVGTSIFDNYREENTKDTFFKSYIEDLKDKGESEYGEEIRRIRDIKNKIAKWINEKKLEDKVDISAEVKSLIKLKEELKEELEIYLLCSDTLLSIVAGEIIEEFIEDNEEMFNTQADRVKKEIIKIYRFQIEKNLKMV